ncbi:ArsR/SmtB family transcription factor [Natronorarus salvus]|uniref:ArsR/SmtB family transcription factor n=1 Tax=Natronorarus salvus TaxID=3117733 RepID=UPI002F25ED44
MAGLLPTDSDAEPSGEPRVIGMDSADAGAVLDALSSETTRRVYVALQEEPAPVSVVADRTDLSLQNARYHVGKLREAGLIEVVDTIYSEKGREMEMFAPADAPMIVVLGDERERNVRDALTRLLGAVALLGFVSALIQQVAAALAPEREESDAVAVETAPAEPGVGDPLLDIALTDPGVLFFLGGLAVLLAAFAVWWTRS